MKFNGKGYHSYVHDRLNESLADKLEKPLDEDETKEIGEEIIEEIAKERVFTLDSELMRRKDIAHSINLGVFAGTNSYMIAQHLINSVINSVRTEDISAYLNEGYLQGAPLIVAGLFSLGVGAGHYFLLKQHFKKGQQNVMGSYRKQVSDVAKKQKRFATPENIAVNNVIHYVCYDLQLPTSASKFLEQKYKKLRQTAQGICALFGFVSAATGYACDQTALGILSGVVFGAVNYAINATNKLEQSYYKRKIDEGIQRIVDEYNAPKPDNPTTPLHIA